LIERVATRPHIESNMTQDMLFHSAVAFNPTS